MAAGLVVDLEYLLFYFSPVSSFISPMAGRGIVAGQTVANA
jgi:hypothetical protein